MSVQEIPGRPGYFRVVVYDRVTAPGARPKKNRRIVKGQKAAEKVERELIRQRERGSVTDQRQTLSAYAGRYLDSRRAEVSAETLEGYRDIVSAYVDRHAIGKMRVGDIDVSAVSTFYADLLERGSRGKPIAPKTVAGVHRILSMILKRATVDGLLYVNPCTVVKVPKDDTAEDEVGAEKGVDPETARDYLRLARELPTYAAAAVAFGTGLRRSELLALRWSDVDFEARELHVRGKVAQLKGCKPERKATKTTRSRRTVPFGANVAAVLEQHKKAIAEMRLAAPPGTWVDEDWVFPGRFVWFTKDGETLPAGDLWSPNSFAQEWRRDRDEVNGRRLGEFVRDGGKVEEFEPWEFGIHAMRHAYTTASLAQGVRVEVVSRRLGHSSSMVTLRVYSHVMRDERREGVDAVDALI